MKSALGEQASSLPSSCSLPAEPKLESQNNQPGTDEQAAKSSGSEQSSAATPHSSSSNGSSRAPSGQPPAGKYKEKRRPEPLDLSVKSAGILPAGSRPFEFRRSDELGQQQALSAPHHSADLSQFHLNGLNSLFNCSTNSTGTLETPRFIWNDTTEALIKPRLFSSSSLAPSQASNRSLFGGGSHLASSLAGDSPPITPSTPNSAYLLERLLSPNSGRFLQHPGGSPVSIQAAAAALMHQHQNMKTPSRLPQDSMMSLSPHLAASNRYFMQQQQQQQQQHSANKTPRRSSSSDNLHIITKQQSIEAKKNAISPLAIKNLSVSPSSTNLACQSSTRTRFTYLSNVANGSSATGETSAGEKTRESKSPIINVTGESQSSSDVQRSPISSNSNSSAGAAPGTPTSGLSSTTAHLLSIQLDSPQSRALAKASEEPASLNGRQAMLTLGDLFMPTSSYPNSAPTKRAANQPLSAGYTPAESAPRLLPVPGAYLSIGTHSSGLNSPGTLDTPTLISPSQLKPNSSTSSMCFLPSPTLSPMSAGFELHSPFAFLDGPVMAAGLAPVDVPAAPSSAKPPVDASSVRLEPEAPRASNEIVPSSLGQTSVAAAATTTTTTTTTTLSHLEQTSSKGASKGALSEDDLAHLVTSARDKLGAAAQVDDDADEMDVDAQTIPRIYVSDEQRRNLEQSQPSANQQAWPWPLDHQQQQHQFQQHPNSAATNHETPVELSIACQHRSQRDAAAKRALSPNSFQARVNQYKSERVESCSAPPIGSPRVRPKLKSAAGPESCSDLNPAEQAQTFASPLAQPLGQHFRLSQAPYGGLHSRWMSTSSNLQPHYSQHATYRQDMGRSSSAEPALVSYPTSGLYAQAPACGSQAPQMSRSAQHLSRGSSGLASNMGAGSFECCPHQSSLSAQELNRYQGQHQQQLEQLSSQAQLRPVATNLSHGQLRQSLAQDGHSGHPMGQSHSCSDILLNQSTNSAQLTAGMGQQGLLYENPVHPQPLPPNSFALDGQQLPGAPPAPLHLQPTNHGASVSHLTIPRAGGQTSCVGVPDEDRQRSYSTDGRQLGSAAQGGSPALSLDESPGQMARSLSAGPQTPAVKKYHCDQCEKSFTRSDMLTRHKRLHSGDRPYKCDKCKQVFSRSDHLLTHTRTHTGEKPYYCKLCSYSACRKDMITRHMKVHNRSSPGLNFQ